MVVLAGSRSRGVLQAAVPALLGALAFVFWFLAISSVIESAFGGGGIETTSDPLSRVREALELAAFDVSSSPFNVGSLLLAAAPVVIAGAMVGLLAALYAAPAAGEPPSLPSARQVARHILVFSLVVSGAALLYQIHLFLPSFVRDVPRVVRFYGLFPFDLVRGLVLSPLAVFILVGVGTAICAVFARAALRPRGQAGPFAPFPPPPTFTWHGALLGAGTVFALICVPSVVAQLAGGFGVAWGLYIAGAFARALINLPVGLLVGGFAPYLVSWNRDKADHHALHAMG